MLYRDGEVGRIVNLIKDHATMETVKDFLRRQGVPTTARNREDLFESRLKESALAGEFPHEDLIEFLRDSEEFGRQQIFLFRVTREAAEYVMRRQRVRAALSRSGLGEILEKPRVFDMPDEPQIVDVRWERGSRSEAMVVKIVERRARMRRVAHDVRDESLARHVKGYSGGSLFATIFQEEEIRAVSVFRMHSFGLLEVRVFTHWTASETKYRAALGELWKVVNHLIPIDQFEGKELSLEPAKRELWSKRSVYADEIRYSDSGLRNSMGNKIHVATGEADGTLFDDDMSEKSIDTWSKGGAKYDHLNLWWKKQPDGGTPSRAVHVLLGGLRNEFVITGKCLRRDYEHVLRRIRQNNS